MEQFHLKLEQFNHIRARVDDARSRMVALFCRVDKDKEKQVFFGAEAEEEEDGDEEDAQPALPFETDQRQRQQRTSTSQPSTPSSRRKTHIGDALKKRVASGVTAAVDLPAKLPTLVAKKKGSGPLFQGQGLRRQGTRSPAHSVSLHAARNDEGPRLSLDASEINQITKRGGSGGKMGLSGVDIAAWTEQVLSIAIVLSMEIVLPASLCLPSAILE